MTAPSNARLTVLLIDDNPDLLRALSLSLGVLGNFHVVSAVDGLEGLEKFFECKPDCVVIDVKMPELDGYQLVQALRGDPASEMTPLIILTALAQDRDKFAGLAVGADAYLVKPVKPQDLTLVIRQVTAIDSAERIRRWRQIAQEEPPTQ